MVWSPLSYTPGLRRSLSFLAPGLAGGASVCLERTAEPVRGPEARSVAFSGRGPGRVSTRAVDRSFVVPGANAEEACVSLASKYEFLRALLLNATELELSPIQKFLRLSPYAYAKGSNLHPRHDSPSRLHGPARAQSSDPARPQHTCTIREDSAARLRAPPSRGAGTRRTNEE